METNIESSGVGVPAPVKRRRMPSSAEILARFKERLPGDPLGFEVEEYVDYLSFQDVMSLAGIGIAPKEGITEAEWEAARPKLTREFMLAKMLDYMPFAWEKANGKRGVSASRSVSHYLAWTWLAGDRKFSARLDRKLATHYAPYGKPLLRIICKHYGWDAEQWKSA